MIYHEPAVDISHAMAYKLLDILRVTDPTKVTTGNGLEKVMRDIGKRPDVMVKRTDYKNNLPDFIVSTEYGKYMFIECKFYGRLKDKHWFKIIKAYEKKQPKQYEAFNKLILDAPVYFLTVAQGKDDVRPEFKLIQLRSGEILHLMDPYDEV